MNQDAPGIGLAADTGRLDFFTFPLHPFNSISKKGFSRIASPSLQHLARGTRDARIPTKASPHILQISEKEALTGKIRFAKSIGEADSTGPPALVNSQHTHSAKR